MRDLFPCFIRYLQVLSTISPSLWIKGKFEAMDLEVARTPDVEDGGRCLCGRDSTEGGAEDETLGLQVQFSQHIGQAACVKLSCLHSKQFRYDHFSESTNHHVF